MKNWKYILFTFLGLPTEEKEVLEPGVLGYYDCKPYENFHYAFVYAKENEIYNDGDIEIWTRSYKNTTFVNVLVNDETNFNVDEYSYEILKPRIQEKGLEAYDKSILIVGFQKKNENTISYCKKLCKSDKQNFVQGLVYNQHTVHMEYYKPVPKFWKLFDLFCEDIYYDWGCYDSEKD